MRLGHLFLLSSLVLSPALSASAASHARHTTTKSFARKTVSKPRILGQRTIEDSRATQIQAALIKAGYLTGAPSGHWDAESEAAMSKLQAENGWQTKLVPDSRALIKLGLGPSPTPAGTTPASPSATAQLSPGGSGALGSSSATPR
jgi:hypothetical protein